MEKNIFSFLKMPNFNFFDYNFSHGGKKSKEKITGKSFLSDNELKTLNNGDGPIHHLARVIRKDYYCEDTIKRIKILYLVAVIIWFVIIFWLDLYDVGVLGWFFILLPVFVFGVNFSFLESCTKDTENDLFAGNFLSFAFLVTAIIISWTKTPTRPYYYKVLLVALFFIMLSLVDFWVPKKHMPISKHLRMIFQTSALSLLALAIYKYYREILSSKKYKNSQAI